MLKARTILPLSFDFFSFKTPSVNRNDDCCLYIYDRSAYAVFVVELQVYFWRIHVAYSAFKY